MQMRSTCTLVCTIFGMLFPLVSSAAEKAPLRRTATAERIARSHKILAEDVWNGFRRTQFDFNGRKASVVEPSCEPAEGRPWTWTMQWWDAFVDRTGVPDLLAKGYHHVWIDLFATRFDDGGAKEAAAFQKFLVDELGFAPKARLVGMSWGGMASVRYASTYPGNVLKMYLDAPLLDLSNFGLMKASFTPNEAAKQIGPWASLEPAGGSWATDPRMAVNRAEPIAKAKIPILLLYGGQDQTVPPGPNCELFAERFKSFGGDVKIVRRGGFGHHPHGVDPNKTAVIVDFLK